MMFFLQVTMETVKRQGDRISELEAKLESDNPSGAKPAEGKFGGHFRSLCDIDFNH